MGMVNWNKRKYTPEEFIQAWLGSITVGEVARKLGCNHSGGGYVVLKAAARELNLASDHMAEYGLNTSPGYNHIKFIPLAEILIEHSSLYQHCSFKNTLVTRGTFRTQVLWSRLRADGLARKTDFLAARSY